MNSHPDTPAQQGHASMTTREKLILLCIVLGTFTFQFEAFLINVALPSMASELKASTTEISFAVLSYLLATTVILVPAGKLGERFGLRTTFLIGCSLATIGTLLSGLSINLLMLCLCRFLQGLGMGGMVATAYAMIPLWLGKKHAGRSYGLLAMGSGIGMVTGLPIGGVLSHSLSWHWIFLTTTPIFVALLILSWKVLPHDQNPDRSQVKLNWGGLLIFGAMLSSAVMAVSLGSELGWTSPVIIFFLIATLLLAACIALRPVMKAQLFSPDLLSISGFKPALTTLFLYALVTSGVRFLGPFYLQLECGLTVLMSSLLLLSYPISYAPTGVWAGQLADKIGSRTLVTLACLLGALFCFIYGLVLQSSHVWMFIVFMLSYGLATGLFFPPNNRFSMSNVPAAKSAEAGALMPIALNMGSLFGVSLFDTVLTFDLPDGTLLINVHGSEAVRSLQSLNHGFAYSFMLGALILLLAGVVTLMTYGNHKTRHAQSVKP